MKTQQRGGFLLGLIVGVLVGLALALGVALYVTKTPVPFVNKLPQRTPEQDAAEAARNKNWDPNAPLAGKPAPKPPAGTAPAQAPVTTSPATAAVPPATNTPVPRTAATPPAAVASTAAAVGAFTYFVQAGAYAHSEEAEQQRARLAMLGHEAKLSEREQSGRTVYRVRLGPYETQQDAEAARGRLSGSGIESVLVRVQK